jgi:hypothetical protein
VFEFVPEPEVPVEEPEGAEPVPVAVESVPDVPIVPEPVVPVPGEGDGFTAA